MKLFQKNKAPKQKQYVSAAPKRRVSKKKKKQRILIGVIVVLLLFSIGTFIKNKIDDQKQIWEQNQTGTIEKVDADKKATDDNGNEIETELSAKITVLSVGDGDAVFIKNGSIEALIDTGNGSSNKVSEFAGSETSGKLDYLILTNADSSSAGGLKSVVNEVTVGTFIYAYSPSKGSATYSSFTDSKSKLKENGTTIKKANDQNIDLGDGITLTVQKGLSDGSDSDKNAICVVNYKGDQFIVSGNASDKLLKAKLASDNDVFAFVASNSGAESSNTMKLLNRIDPENIIVSSAKPGKSKTFSKSMYEKLEDKGSIITTYEAGNIEFTITKDSQFSLVEKSNS